MATRKEIRDVIGSVISPAVDCPVYATRAMDATNLSAYVRVYFSEGEVDRSHLEETEAELIISYADVQVRTDDQLDAIEASISSALSENLISALSAANVSGVLWFLSAGFNYGDDDQRQHSTINLIFRIRYRE